MKGLLKNLGLIMILAAAAIEIGCHFVGNVNNNIIWGCSFALIVIGLIVYIVANKMIAD